MDNGLADFQTRAEAYLHGQLRPGKDSLSDIIKEVTRLATAHDDNPLKELFRAADHGRSATSPPRIPLSSTSSRSTQPEPASGPKSSKFSLNFRRKKKTEDCPAGPSIQRPQTAGSASKNASRNDSEMWSDHAPRLEVLGFGDATNKKLTPATAGSSSGCKNPKSKSSSAVSYNCVFCGDDYSSKGTCKRHLDEMHVARKYLQCNKCQTKLKTVPEARKHTDGCSGGVLGWSECKPPPRQVYSSAFEAKTFRTQQMYTDHLLELCAQSPEKRPNASQHTKIRNLLNQAELQDPVNAVSVRLFRNTTSWRDVRWKADRLREAIDELEYAHYGMQEPEMRVFGQGTQGQIESFLERLFADGNFAAPASSVTDSGSTSVIDEKSVHASDVSMKQETPQPTPQPNSETYLPEHSALPPEADLHIPESYYHTPNTRTPTADSTSKRPLSYESAARIPDRMPPGPPSGFPDVYSNNNRHHHSPMPDHYASSMSMPVTTTYDTTPMSSSIVSWPMSEQPPPYDGMLVHSMTPQAQYHQSGVAGSTMPTTMEYYTSPMQAMPTSHYIPTQTSGDHTMDMYPQHHHHEQQTHHQQSQHHHYGGVYDVGHYEHQQQETHHDTASTAHWLSMPNERHMHPSQLQNQQQQNQQSTTPNGGNVLVQPRGAYNTYQGGIMDSLC